MKRESSSETGTVFKLSPEELNDKQHVKVIPEFDKQSTLIKIILFPGIEGLVRTFKNLARRLDNAVPLQYMPDGESTSVAKIVEGLIPVRLLFLCTNIFMHIFLDCTKIVAARRTFHLCGLFLWNTDSAGDGALFRKSRSFRNSHMYRRRSASHKANPERSGNQSTVTIRLDPPAIVFLHTMRRGGS